jgi:hypothetical protein
VIRVPRYAYRCYLALINSQPSRRKRHLKGSVTRHRLRTARYKPARPPAAPTHPFVRAISRVGRVRCLSSAPLARPGPRGRNRSGAVEYPCTPGEHEQSDRNKSRNHPHAAARAHPDRLSRIPVIQRTRSRRSLAQLYSTRAPPNGPIRRQIQVRWGASRSSVAGSAHSVLRPGRAVSMVPSLCLPLSLFLSLSLSLHLSHTCPFLSPFCHPDVLARHSCGRRRTAAASRSRQASRGLA